MTQPLSTSFLQVLQDRSQLGCYVHLNHRLQDVMVLSDPEYQVKFQIPSSATQEEVVSIIFKRLAGSDEDEPVGREISIKNDL